MASHTQRKPQDKPYTQVARKQVTEVTKRHIMHPDNQGLSHIRNHEHRYPGNRSQRSNHQAVHIKVIKGQEIHR